MLIFQGVFISWEPNKNSTTWQHENGAQKTFIFGGQPFKNKAFSNQNNGHVAFQMIPNINWLHDNIICSTLEVNHHLKLKTWHTSFWMMTNLSKTVKLINLQKMVAWWTSREKRWSVKGISFPNGCLFKHEETPTVQGRIINYNHQKPWKTKKTQLPEGQTNLHMTFFHFNHLQHLQPYQPPPPPGALFITAWASVNTSAPASLKSWSENSEFTPAPAWEDREGCESWRASSGCRVFRVGLGGGVGLGSVFEIMLYVLKSYIIYTNIHFWRWKSIGFLRICRRIHVILP